MSRVNRGDTIIEVILAFGIFAMLAVGTTLVMNRGLASGQQSLERTLVRQQIDSQADLLRYARDNMPAVWDSITSNLATAPGDSSFLDCPTGAPPRSFVMNVHNNSVFRVALGGNYSPAGYYSEVNYGPTPTASGLWVTPVRAETDNAYDMYIRACWNSTGSSRPLVVSTIVRLYET